MSQVYIMGLRVLAITGHSDLPETFQFIGLHNAGVQIHVICPETAAYKQLLLDAGIKVTWLKMKSRFDSAARAAIKAILDKGDIDIIHVFNIRRYRIHYR